MRRNSVIVAAVVVGMMSGLCWGAKPVAKAATSAPATTPAGRTLYVDTNNLQASDQNPGSAALPFKTIQAAVDKADAADTVMVMPGIYRESVKVSKSGLSKEQMFQIVSAKPLGAIIRGSEVVTDWQPAGAGLFRIAWPKKMPHNQARMFGVKSVAEAVWIDGQVLAPVASRDGMKEGTFCADNNEKQLYIRLANSDSPAGHLVEVARRASWLSVSGNFVRVAGFRMEQAAVTIQQDGAIVTGSDCVIEDSEFSNASAGIGLKVRGDRNLVRRCNVHHNGQMGIGGAGRDNVWEDNFVHHNNTRPITDWECGVGKFCRSIGGTWRRNVFSDTLTGPGLWFDIDNYDNLIEQNLFLNIGDNALMIEISYRNVARNNIIVNTNPNGIDGYSRTGILVQLSSATKIYNNLIYGTQGYGVHLRWHDRKRGQHPYPKISDEQFRQTYGFNSADWMGPDDQYPVKDNEIFNNLFVNNAQAAIRIDPHKDFVSNNKSDYNLFVDYKSGHPMDGGHRLLEWQKMTGLDEHSIFVRPSQPVPLFVNMEQMDFRLADESVAIDAGMPIEDLKVDFTGQPRAGTPDIGPYEYVAPAATQPANGQAKSGKKGAKAATTTSTAPARYVAPQGKSDYE